jgi:hypothetical protein
MPHLKVAAQPPQGHQPKPQSLLLDNNPDIPLSVATF